MTTESNWKYHYKHRAIGYRSKINSLLIENKPTIN